MPLFFDIKRYSIHDGPGIRITIFMKGCPLSCIWCHNPEGVSPHKQKMYARKKCIGCERCVEICPEQALTLSSDGIKSDHNRCVLCGECIRICPTTALEMSGNEYTLDYLIREIEKERIFMDHSGGGVTFSGGEPLLFPDTLSDLLLRCKSIGVHRAVDTSLYAKKETVATIMNEIDLFLVDLKHIGAERHRQFCGVTNELILNNLQMIAAAGKDFMIRIPLIGGINADEENLARTAGFLAALTWERKMITLLPFHEAADVKYEKSGAKYNPDNIPMTKPTCEQLQRSMEIFSQHGFHTTIGG